MNVIEQLIPLAEAHQRNDEYVAGTYHWDYGACAIGCSIHDAQQLGLLSPGCKPSDHNSLAQATGMPVWSWLVVDTIFENLPDSERPAFPPAFLRAAAKCTNWHVALARFMVGVLTPTLPYDRAGAVQPVIDLWQRVADGETNKSLELEFSEAKAQAERAVALESSRAGKAVAALAPHHRRADVWASYSVARAAVRATEVPSSAVALEHALSWVQEAMEGPAMNDAICVQRDALLAALAS